LGNENVVKKSKSGRSSRRAVAPTEMSSTQRRSSRKNLKVDTRSNGDKRANSDLRSPGQRKTPSKGATPDFITQTDQYGNASTPRSSGAISKARQGHPSGPKPHLHISNGGDLTEESDEEPSQTQMEACAETLIDSIRLMCCCITPEGSVGHGKQNPQRPQAVEKQAPMGLLPALHPDDHGKKCLVLDLDETLVHSSFRAVPGADFVIPVQIEDVVHFVYVAKRPGVDEFLVEMAKHYEIVIYTASLNKYADPLLDLLDPHRTIRTRLFRESCVYYEGNYVKDLSLLDRDLSDTIIVDNSPNSFIFHPENAIDCSSFIDDPRDRELDQIGYFLSSVKDVDDVRTVCQSWRDWKVPNS